KRSRPGALRRSGSRAAARTNSPLKRSRGSRVAASPGFVPCQPTAARAAGAGAGTRADRRCRDSSGNWGRVTGIFLYGSHGESEFSAHGDGDLRKKKPSACRIGAASSIYKDHEGLLGRARELRVRCPRARRLARGFIPIALRAPLFFGALGATALKPRA